jgi:AcrR family transcriptional regulator
MRTKQRARNAEDKGERRATIVAAARSLWARAFDPSFTIADVAEAAGLAKGTVYLYFTTKEELLLALLAEDLEAWFRTIDARLDGDSLADAPCTPEAFAALVRDTLVANPGFMRLLGLLHAVLERNLELDAIVRFKRLALAHVEATGARIEKVLGAMAEGDGARLVLFVHALVIGLEPMANPAPRAAAALETPGLERLRVDFGDALAFAVEALVRRMQRAH